MRTGSEVITIAPQPGPQTQFLATTADVAVYGGAAGGGKSFALLLDPLRHYNNSKFGGTIFRRTSVQIRSQGGLWDASMALYPMVYGEPRSGSLDWTFPSGMSMNFANLEHENDVLNYQGSEIPWQGFDELTHFTENQFFYMLSRNRSTSGVKSRMRATTNPDPDSWVKRLIRWWLDDAGQFPDPAKSGKIRWFHRSGDAMVWADSREELVEMFGNDPDVDPISVTFIAAKLEDNKILMSKDPKYRARLLAMNRVDRMRLLYGDWLMRANAGTLFKREWFKVIDAIPSGWRSVIRFWDRAATRPHEGNKDPDWTRGLLLYSYPNGRFLVADLKSMRDTPGSVEDLIKNVASHDGHAVRISCQQDPGSAGVSESEHFIRMLNGYDVHTIPFTKDKVTRAKPVSAQCEAGNVDVLRSTWNEEFFAELENFSDELIGHDDIVDVLSGAHSQIGGGMSICDALWQMG